MKNDGGPRGAALMTGVLPPCTVGSWMGAMASHDVAGIVSR